MGTAAAHLLWFDGPTGTALVLSPGALLQVALFPGAHLVVFGGGGSAVLSRAGRGWNVRRLSGRLAVETVLLLPRIAAMLVRLRAGEATLA